MTRRILLPIAALAALMIGGTAMAQTDAPFHAGPVFTDFGKVTPVDSDLPVPRDTVFKVVFDSAKGAEPGTVNRVLDNAARFINMNVAAGVAVENIHVVIVMHGAAGADLTSDAFYRAHHDGKANASAAPLAQLIDHGVTVYLCGQSAARMGLTREVLLPGVKMALSAMTAHALLQQQGYTLNPF